MAMMLSVRCRAVAPAAANMTLAHEIWLGVMSVPARNEESATIAALERVLIGRLLVSMSVGVGCGHGIVGSASLYTWFTSDVRILEGIHTFSMTINNKIRIGRLLSG